MASQGVDDLDAFASKVAPLAPYVRLHPAGGVRATCEDGGIWRTSHEGPGPTTFCLRVRASEVVGGGSVGCTELAHWVVSYPVWYPRYWRSHPRRQRHASCPQRPDVCRRAGRGFPPSREARPANPRSPHPTVELLSYYSYESRAGGSATPKHLYFPVREVGNCGFAPGSADPHGRTRLVEFS